MSTSDQAFIRAYSRDGAEPTPPSPHWSYTGGGSRSRQTYPVSQSAEPNPNQVEPPLSESDAEPPTSGWATPSAIPRVPLMDGRVTSYVPPPHVPMTASTAGSVDDTSGNLASTDKRSRTKQGRQPLSSFRAMRDESDDFVPALAVERFVWPGECDALVERTPESFDQLMGQLMAQAEQGFAVTAVAGCHRGDGRKTVLLTLARELSRHHIKVAMVDADFYRANLAARLGLAVQVGWEDILCRGLPLAEAVITADQSGATLLPMKDIVAEPAALFEGELAPVSLRVLRRHSDIVLVDVGPLLDDRAAAAALTFAVRSGLDAALVVQNARRSGTGNGPDDISEVTNRLSIVGIPVVGIVENFAVRPAIVHDRAATSTDSLSSSLPV